MNRSDSAGSHIRFTKVLQGGDEHHITIPAHEEVKKGTINDILSRLSEKNDISKDDLIDILNDL